MSAYIEIGVISEVAGAKARVAIGSMVTDFLPLLQKANSFIKEWTPLKVGEQVVVLPIRGDLNSGVILRSLYQSAYTAPTNDENIKMIVFSDGTKISYDTNSSTLEIWSPKTINISASTEINLNAPNVNIKGNLSVSGIIKDKLGDLTNHSHKDSDGATSLPR